MSVLTVKLRRDLARRPAQLIWVGMLVALGVALYGASYDAYRNLQASYTDIFSRYRFADLTVDGGNTATIARQAARTPGVAATTTRTVTDVPLRIGGAAPFPGRVVGLPAGGQPAVDRVDVLSGRYLNPAAPQGVLAEKHLAQNAGLRPGAAVQVWQHRSWQALTVSGVVSSPEYLWPAPSRQDILPAPGSFGVLFVPEALARQIAGPAAAPNQVLIYYTPAARGHAARLGARLASMARRQGAAATVTRADQPSNAALSEDIKGFAELALLFPMLFLGAAGLAAYVVLTRRVAADRAIIGMLRASGFGRRAVLRNYLWIGLITGLAGAVPGVLAGIVAAGAVTHLYTKAIGLPVTLVSARASTVAGGLAFGLVTGALAALAPALSASRVPPAEAMRGLVPATRGGRGPLARAEHAIPAARRLPAGAWLVLRGPARQPRRTLYTEIGVILALVLVLVSWGMLDTIRVTLARQFGHVQREDAQLTLAQPASAPFLARLARLPGVAAAEPSTQLPVTLGAGTYTTALIGLQTGTTMHDFLKPGGGTQHLPGSGLLLGVALRGKLHIQVGSPVMLRLPGGRAATATVAGFVDEPLGTYAYTSLSQIHALDPIAQPTTVLLRYTPGANRDHLRHTLATVPGVIAYTDTQALKQVAARYINLFYVFIAVMLVFGALLAFTVLFATMSVNLTERRTETAALRVSGVPQRRLSQLITTENLLLVTTALIPGLILGRLATAEFLGAFNSDLMRFHTDIRPATYAYSAAAAVAVALIAQLPGLRQLARLDLAAAVREGAA
ncbi:MAG: ABC transporter permease [Micromonosporaceae bacterium]